MRPAVFFPSLDLAFNLVPFLIDTGADTTLLLPDRAQALAGLDYRRFTAFPVVDVAGFGGGFTVHKVPATLIFSTDSDPHQLTIPIEIARPSAQTYGLPSVLGRDVIDLFRLTVDRSADLIALTDVGVPA